MRIRISTTSSHISSSSLISLRLCKLGVSHIAQRSPLTLRSRYAHSHLSNQVLPPITTPPIFHDHLRLASSSNTLLLLLFTTSSCLPCRTISPLLQSLVTTRSQGPADQFSAVAFAEVELDSPDRGNGAVADLGFEYGISSIPSLVGFGGRRAERVTERVVDIKMMTSRDRMKAWIDEWMEKGDPFGTDSGGGSSTGSIFGKFFGGS